MALQKQVFAQIQKIDLEKRIVTGIASDETRDNDGEVMDYATSKAHFQEWSAGYETKTGGKSFGNVREMHQLKAAGKLSEMPVFDDASRTIVVKSYVSDDSTWQKCQDGTLTGFSIAGGVVGAKWLDPVKKAMRYTVRPREISLVDAPCNPGATFFAIKADGAQEARELHGNEATVLKSLYSIGELCDAMSSLKWVGMDLAMDEEYGEGDMDPEVSGKIKDALTALSDALSSLATKEGGKLLDSMKAAGARKRMDIAKVGKKMSAGTMETVGKAKDALASMGACMTNGCDHTTNGKCSESMMTNHAAATSALASLGNVADTSAGDATKALPATDVLPTQTGDEPMDEVQKAQLAKAATDIEKATQDAAKAATDSAEALTIAKANNVLLEGLLVALAGPEPDDKTVVKAAKSHSGAAPSIAVTKTQDQTGDEGGDPVEKAMKAKYESPEEKALAVTKAVHSNRAENHDRKSFGALNIGR